MYSGAAEYRFNFPALGDRFTTATMVARDPYPNIKSPEQLEREGVTVKLGLAPQVNVRRNTAEGHVESTVLVKAMVLLNATR
jgi:hypothetical protein